MVIHPAEAGRSPAYKIDVPDQFRPPVAPPPPAAAEPEQPVEARCSPAASVEKPVRNPPPRSASACHSFDKGGPNKVGPNLYGIVERDKGSHAGFNYSGPMKGKGGKWTFDDLNHFLTNPKAFVAGTSMSFAGLTKDSERADVIDYLRTLADSPVPLPKAAAK